MKKPTMANCKQTTVAKPVTQSPYIAVVGGEGDWVKASEGRQASESEQRRRRNRQVLKKTLFFILKNRL